jgi:hypothetical protein
MCLSQHGCIVYYKVNVTHLLASTSEHDALVLAQGTIKTSSVCKILKIGNGKPHQNPSVHMFNFDNKRKTIYPQFLSLKGSVRF